MMGYRLLRGKRRGHFILEVHAGGAHYRFAVYQLAGLWWAHGDLLLRLPVSMHSRGAAVSNVLTLCAGVRYGH